jgi:hypothetical protein
VIDLQQFDGALLDQSAGSGCRSETVPARNALSQREETR